MELKDSIRINARREDVFAALNDPDVLARAIPGCKELEKVSDTEFTATVVVKVGPVKATFKGQVTLSDIVPPESYFPKIQAVLRKHEVLMVADEVICGLGRTGNWWGSETFEIEPDILTCAKALSSAYLPISAVLISEEIFEALRAQSASLGIFGHGFTYSGHPVCAAVALRTLELMEEREIIAHVRRVAPRFQQRLEGFAGHPLVGEARGVGLIGALELSPDKAAHARFDPALKMAPKLQALCQEEGLILRALPDDAIGFCPPLIITEDQIDDMFDRFARALDRLTERASKEAAE